MVSGVRADANVSVNINVCGVEDSIFANRFANLVAGSMLGGVDGGVN